MTKTAIVTGHSRGLGAAFANILPDYGYAVAGLSRSNGHDLDQSIESFIDTKFDLYVNNAYCGYQQTELLYRLFELNKDRNCTILNIGSVSALGTKDYINTYAIHKKSLHEASKQLHLINSECRVIHVALGRIATEMTAHRAAYPRMNIYNVATYILNVMSTKEDFYLKDITLDVRFSNTPIDER